MDICVIGGIVAEAHERLGKEGHALPYPGPELRKRNSFAYVDPDWWGLVVFEMMQETGVNLLLHSLVLDTLKGLRGGEKGKYKGEIFNNQSAGYEGVPSRAILGKGG